MTLLDTSRIRAEVVRIARANLGYGEHNRNFLTAIGAKADHEWCAIFASYCYSRAHANLKFEPPTWCYRRNAPEPGAKRLTRGLGSAGRLWKPSERDVAYGLCPKPGDLVCWHRGRLGPLDWRGHVGIIFVADSAGFASIEGNVGRKVVLRNHTYTEPRLWRFASMERA